MRLVVLIKFEIKKRLGKGGKQALRQTGFPSRIEKWGEANFAWGNFDNSMLLSC